MLQLQRLAVDHAANRGQQIAERADDAGRRRQLERANEQEVAAEHRRRVAPQDARRRHAAPHAPVVEDVVVQQRRGVHQLGRLRELGHRGARRQATRPRRPRRAPTRTTSSGRTRLPPAPSRWRAARAGQAGATVGERRQPVLHVGDDVADEQLERAQSSVHRIGIRPRRAASANRSVVAASSACARIPGPLLQSALAKFQKVLKLHNEHQGCQGGSQAASPWYSVGR